jgi:hypothetical protein
MYLSQRGRTRRRGLGTISTMVGGSLIMGSDAIARPGPRYPIMRPTQPTNGSPWKSNISPAWGSGYQPSGPYQVPAQPSGSLNLAQLQQLAQSNPSALTPSQIQQLEAAGTIAGTVPPTSAGLINSTNSAIDPATGQTYASELAMAQAAATLPATASSSVMGVDPTTGATTIFGVDWYWLAAAAVGVFLFTQQRGRR